MTQNRRIVLNIVATYGRSVYSAVLGLFTARWVLMSLDRSIMDCSASLAGWLADDWIAAKMVKYTTQDECYTLWNRKW